MVEKNKFLRGKIINPEPIKSDLSVTRLIEEHFNAYNGARLQEACFLMAGNVMKEDVTVGISLTGALTPAGLGKSCIVPLMANGFVDWISSTGANLYHDTHYGLGLALHKGSPFTDDVELKENNVVRIYDILMSFDVLLSTDNFFKEIIKAPEFQRKMGTAELHYNIGKYIREMEKKTSSLPSTILSAAYEYGVPVYTPSPGDSSIGMNIAAGDLVGNGLKIDPIADVNETTAIVYNAKKDNGKSAVFIIGGGSPKNFMLQTEPQIQEVMGLDEKGHDYFIQITDARPDTGGLSGATPSEAVSWGKVDPEMLPNAIVAYLDFTVALPLITTYVMAKCDPRKHRRLYDKRVELVEKLKKAFLSKK